MKSNKNKNKTYRTLLSRAGLLLISCLLASLGSYAQLASDSNKACSQAMLLKYGINYDSYLTKGSVGYYKYSKPQLPYYKMKLISIGKTKNEFSLHYPPRKNCEELDTSKSGLGVGSWADAHFVTDANSETSYFIKISHAIQDSLAIFYTGYSKPNDYFTEPESLVLNAPLLINYKDYSIFRDYDYMSSMSRFCKTSVNDTNAIDMYYSFISTDTTMTVSLNMSNPEDETLIQYYGRNKNACLDDNKVGLAVRNYTMTGLIIGSEYKIRLEIGKSDNTSFSDNISLALSKGSDNSPWTAVIAGQSNHVISIPAAVISSINGNSLAVGDYIGVFFDNGTQCGGFQKWTGKGTTLTAFGNTNGTAQNGFNTGEQFILKVWKLSDAKEYIVKAEYDTTSPNVQGSYASNALSSILSITFDSCTVQNLNLYKGWNLVSLFVTPKDASMSTVFQGVSPIIVKNALGTVLYAPQNGITNGTWNSAEGYLVFSAKPHNVLVCGTKINPATTIDIPNNPYPYFLPYLFQEEYAVQSIMTSVENDIQYIQSMEYTPNANVVQAYNYIPRHIIDPAIDQIGKMKPGLGYKVLTQSAIPSFSYSAFNKAVSSRFEHQSSDFTKQVSQHFGVVVPGKGSNAVVVIPHSIFNPALQSGDELGVFAPNGTLVGSAVSTGTNLAVTVWDNTGMDEGDNLGFKIWRKNQNLEKEVNIPFIGSGGNFKSNSLQLASKLPSGLSVNRNLPDGNALLCYPNPTSQTIAFQTNATLEIADMRIFNSLGTLIDEQENVNFTSGQLNYNCNNLDNGLYYVSIKSKGTEVKAKFVVSR